MATTRREFLKRSAMVAAGAVSLPALLPHCRSSGDWVRGLSLNLSDFQDLRFLEPLLTNVRIVQLGENGHGTSEATRLRARIATYLFQELGFRVMAFESSLFLCHLANIDVRPEPTRMLTSSLIGVWHTEEMLRLFERIVKSRAMRQPIQLAGFDVQPIGRAKRRRPSFFSSVVTPIDAEYGSAVTAMDSEFLAAYDQGSRARREYLRREGARLADEYDRLASFIEEHFAALQRRSGRTAALVAKQEARSMAAYVRFQSATDMRSYAEIRDRGMFRNLKFLSEELFPSEKIIVWGHNYHLRHDNASIPPSDEVFPGVTARSMGTWTRQQFGAAVFTIGQYEGSGTALDNSRKPYTIASPETGTLEHRLQGLSAGPSFVNVRAAAGQREGAWLNSAVTARFNGQHPEVLVPARQYDALVVLPNVTPPTFLY